MTPTAKSAEDLSGVQQWPVFRRPSRRVNRYTTGWTCNAVSEKVPFGTESKRCIRGRAILDVFRAHLSYPESMAVQWASQVEWEQLQSAFGDSREVGELLKLILVGEDVWGDLIGHVMHQGTIYEGTIAVAGWLVDALQTKRLDKRMIPVGKVFGRSDVLSERAIAFGVLSSMAEDARDALHSTSTPERYAALAALVLEALRPGIPLYEAGAKDSDDEINEASATLLDALARGSVAGIDRQYLLSVGKKLGMPLPPA